MLINAPFTEQTSYGIVSLNIANELEKMGQTPALFPLNRDIDCPKHMEDNIKTAYLRSEDCDFNDACLKIYHQFDLAGMIGRGYRIGFPIFELDNFTQKERNHLSSCDVLLVCSTWAQNILYENNLDEIESYVVPLGVDRNIFNENGRQDEDIFRIYCPGKWEIRKGHFEFKEIIEKAFEPTDNVEIYFTPINLALDQNYNDGWFRYYQQSKLYPKMRFINRTQSYANISELYKKINCIVSPSKAEGWNLPLLEGMASGCDIITTDYSGHTAFCNNENSTLIQPTGLELAYDGYFFFEQGSWAKFSINDFAQTLRDKYKSWKNGWEVNRAGIETSKVFTWKETANKCLI